MNPLTFVYLHPLHFGKPLPLKTLVPGAGPVVWLEDPRYLLHAGSWLGDAHGIRPWLSRNWGHDSAETGMRREWSSLDFGDRPRVVVCPGAESFRIATGFAADHGIEHLRVQAVPDGDHWRLADAPETPVEAFHFPIELHDLRDPLELAPIVRDFPWPAALFGLSYGSPGTWFHLAGDGTTTAIPARANAMMTDVPVDLYGWFADPGAGPVLHAVLSAVVEPDQLWACEAELARRLRSWAELRPDQRQGPLTVRPKPKQLARQLEEYLHGDELVAGVTLMRTVAADEPVAARLEELARWYNRVDDFRHAVGLVEAALRLEPDNLSLITNRLRLRIAYGDRDRARADLEAARRSRSDFVLDLLAFNLAAEGSAAGEALAMGRTVTTRIAAGDAKKLDRHERMDFHLAFAAICLAAGALDDGIAAVNAAVRIEPDHPGAYFLGALMMCGADQWGDAIDALELAEKHGNDSSWAKFVEILARLGCDQMEEALLAAHVCERRLADELMTDGDYGPTLETRALLTAFLHEEKNFSQAAAALAGVEISPEFRFQVRLLCDLDPDLSKLAWPAGCLDG